MPFFRCDHFSLHSLVYWSPLPVLIKWVVVWNNRISNNLHNNIEHVILVKSGYDVAFQTCVQLNGGANFPSVSYAVLCDFPSPISLAWLFIGSMFSCVLLVPPLCFLEDWTTSFIGISELLCRPYLELGIYYSSVSLCTAHITMARLLWLCILGSYYSVWLRVSTTCMSMDHVCDWYLWRIERASDTLEVELEMAGSCRVDAGNQTAVLCKNTHCPWQLRPLPNPDCLLFSGTLKGKLCQFWIQSTQVGKT